MKVLLIVNPISGKGKGKRIASKLLHKFEGLEALFTKSNQTIGALIHESGISDFDRIVAVGGDGTVNQVARYCMDHSIALGVIGIGSGNGFLRSMYLPLDPMKALEVVIRGETKTVDVGQINQERFLCASGIGFDGRVIENFDARGTRGLLGYVFAVIKTLFQHQQQEMKIIVDGKERTEKVYSLVFANGWQFGNNFKIAPKALLDDGLIDVVLFRRLSVFSVIDIFFLGILGTVIRSNRIEVLNAKIVEVYRQGKIHTHYDGEQLTLAGEVKMTILEKALKVYV